MRIVVLGSSGMLGSEVSRVAKQAGREVLEVSRSADVSFDAKQESFVNFANRIGLRDDDFLVNAIGWIPQKSVGIPDLDAHEAILLNSQLIQGIANSKSQLGFRWLQIATDCVYSGGVGDYNEGSAKDAKDVYGKSKVSGESFCSEALMVRCSIIGAENSTSYGLYAWFKNAVKHGPVNGFENHIWNGVTTNTFAHLALGLADSDLSSCNQHLVPSNKVSKYELLHLFARDLSLNRDLVKPVAAEKFVDRSLSTLNNLQNQKLWNLAGYDLIPDIELLVSEMVRLDLERGA